MPNRDGTGPDGLGPKTGRGLGNCAGKAENKENRPRMRGCGYRRRGNNA
jgi:hypothetical protein